MALPNLLKNKLKIPVVVAPMFLASGPELVIETCKAGSVGSFPSLNQRSAEGFETWLTEIKAGLAQAGQEGLMVAPYAVNLIVHKSNPRLSDDLALVVKHQVPIVITSLGINTDVIEAVHSYGGLVFHDVINIRFAQKALGANVDGIVAVCAGAGGHAGTYNPFAFIRELRAITDKTILASGCISEGASILAALSCGADLAYLGSRFIVAEESMVQSDYKDMLVDCSAKDIIYTPKISGVNASFLKPSLDAAGIDINTLVTPDMNAQEDMNSEAKAWSEVWSAGQGVGGIHERDSTANIFAKLQQEYSRALADLNAQQALYI